MTIPSSKNCTIVLFLFVNIMMQVGGVIFGGLSDRFGRKWIMLFCLYRYPIHPANILISAFQTVLISSSFLFSQCAIGIGLHFVHSLMLFIGLRFLIQKSISDKICKLGLIAISNVQVIVKLNQNVSRFTQGIFIQGLQCVTYSMVKFHTAVLHVFFLPRQHYIIIIIGWFYAHARAVMIEKLTPEWF